MDDERDFGKPLIEDDDYTSEDIPICEKFSNATLKDNSTVEISERYENEIDNRNEGYTKFLNEYIVHYTKKSRDNRLLKIIFFALTFTLIGFAVWLLGKTITVFSQKDINAEVLGGIITALVTLATTIIALPLIIAQYLFPKNEDNDMLDLTKSMRREDSEHRHNHKKN